MNDPREVIAKIQSALDDDAFFDIPDEDSEMDARSDAAEARYDREKEG